MRVITQAQLLANAADIQGDALTASALAISVGNGSLADNGNGTWNYTPVADDESSVSFRYTISDGHRIGRRSCDAGHHPGERCPRAQRRQPDTQRWPNAYPQ